MEKEGYLVAGQEWKEIRLAGLPATNSHLSPTLDVDARTKVLSVVLNNCAFVLWSEHG